MRILYVVSKFPTLSETFVLNEIIELKKLGYEIKILSLNKSDEKVVHRKITESGLLSNVIDFDSLSSINYNSGVEKMLDFSKKLFSDFFRLDMRVFRLLIFSYNHCKTIWNFFDIYLKFRPFLNLSIDLIETSFSELEIIKTSFVLSKILNKPYILTFRSYELYRKTDKRNLLKNTNILNSASGYVTISYYNKAFLAENFNIQNVSVVYDSIYVNSFRNLKHYANKHNRLVFIGRFVEQKGVAYLIEACSILNKRGVVFSCVLVGDGPEKSKCESLVKELGVSNVVFRGSLSATEVRNELGEASIFVFPCVVSEDGNCDILANVLKEAMAMGLPVVTSDICGIEELVEDGVSGLLVSPKDPLAIAGAIEKLLKSPELARRMGVAGRKKIVKDFNIEKEVKKLEKIFNVE